MIIPDPRACEWYADLSPLDRAILEIHLRGASSWADVKLRLRAAAHRMTSMAMPAWRFRAPDLDSQERPRRVGPCCRPRGLNRVWVPKPGGTL